MKLSEEIRVLQSDVRNGHGGGYDYNHGWGQALEKAAQLVEANQTTRVVCGYCDTPIDDTPEAFAGHDAACERNPLAAWVRELEERLEQYDSQATAVRVVLTDAGIPESEPYPEEPGLSEYERSLRAGGRMLKAPERIGRLAKRVAELEVQVTEQRAVPIPMGLGEVCVSECHDGDGVLREMVIHARRGAPHPVGTPLPDGYVGLPLPDGEILARIRIENADGARLVLLDSLERCINAAYVADGKAPMPTRADLQSQLVWTPVAKGLPTEPGEYEFLRFGGKGLRHYTRYPEHPFPWSLNEIGETETYSDSEILCVTYTAWRRIELPEAK